MSQVHICLDSKSAIAICFPLSGVSFEELLYLTNFNFPNIKTGDNGSTCED